MRAGPLGFDGSQVLGKLQRQPRPFFHVALHGLLIAPQRVALVGFAQAAAFDIQEQLDLPRPEGVAMHIAAKQFLDEAVELRQDCLAVGDGFVHY